MTTHRSKLPVLGATDDNSELIEDFLKDCDLRGLSPETIRSYKGCLRIFGEHLSETGTLVTEVEKENLKDFLHYLRGEREVATKTIGNYFAVLSSFYDYLTYEGLVQGNPILPFRERYLDRYGSGSSEERQLISVEEMSRLIRSEMNIRNKAILVTFAKTGVRRGELVLTDLDNLDWNEHSIDLPSTRKRSNTTVFFDDEAAKLLRQWVNERNSWNVDEGCDALFVNEQRGRLQRNGVYRAVVKAAERVGLHDPESDRMKDRFTPHCFRHWFTTHLRRNGMPREHIKELRGDSRNEAMDIYHHIDRKELRESYLAHIPKLGV